MLQVHILPKLLVTHLIQPQEHLDLQCLMASGLLTLHASFLETQILVFQLNYLWSQQHKEM